ncbi:AMP-binding protein [Streptomyces sp. NPDC005349]|uniref:AMP-binding protein n=1 Tax=Streptomyces sp. NPDC005349 TaxID=3157037 RepID=UPI0033ADCE4D
MTSSAETSDVTCIRHDLLYRSIPNIVRVNAARHPDLVVIREGVRQLTYADLERAVTAGVRGMMAAGVRPGDRVALWGPNSADWIIAALAVQGAGGILVPLNTRFKGQEAAYVLEKSGARLLLTVTDFLGTDYVAAVRSALPEASEPIRFVVYSGPVPQGVALSWEEFIRQGAERTDERAALERWDAVGPDDLSDIMFTSGTTGRPKGVQLTHGQSLRAFGWHSEVLTFRRGDRFLIVPPFFHTFGYKAGWMACLMYGVTIHPMAVFDAGAAAEIVAREGITILFGPPAVFHDLLEQYGRGAADLSSIRVALVAAASVPPDLFRRLRADLGVEVLVSGYAQTECTSIATTTRPGTDSFDDVVRTVGRAADGVEVRAVDDTGTPVPPGVPGELLVRGYNVMRGYWEDPDATERAIDADGWLHTGDIAVLDERGFVRITDRKKDMYIVGGFNVYPAEVERILGRHAAVAELAVVGAPDRRMGEAGVAFVVPAGDRAFDIDEFLGWARTQIANYKVPARVVLVDELPRNASMKVLKNILRERLGSSTGPGD